MKLEILLKHIIMRASLFVCVYVLFSWSNVYPFTHPPKAGGKEAERYISVRLPKAAFSPVYIMKLEKGLFSTVFLKIQLKLQISFSPPLPPPPFLSCRTQKNFFLSFPMASIIMMKGQSLAFSLCLCLCIII